MVWSPESDIKLYRTRGRQRGVLVVFSYVNFDMMETQRRGVDEDCKNLKYLFDEIGFRVLSYQDLTKKVINDGFVTFPARL